MVYQTACMHALLDLQAYRCMACSNGGTCGVLIVLESAYSWSPASSHTSYWVYTSASPPDTPYPPPPTRTQTDIAARSHAATSRTSSVWLAWVEERQKPPVQCKVWLWSHSQLLTLIRFGLGTAIFKTSILTYIVNSFWC